MAREVRLWEFLRDGLRGTPGLHMRRVENLVSEGDPDVDGCHLGRYFDVELKGCDRPAHGGRLHFEIRRAQSLWHRKRTKAEGNNWLYVRVGSGRLVKKYLIPGEHIPRLFELQETLGVCEADLIALAVLDPQHTAMEFLTKIRDGAPRTSK